MSAMTNVSKLPPPRISEVSHQVVAEIATRTDAPVEVVLEAMMVTSLSNQRALMDNINRLRA